MSPKLKTAIKIGFSVLILVMLFFFLDFKKVNYENISITPIQGVIIFLLVVATFAIRAWRWQLIINEKIESSKNKLSFPFAVKFLLVGTTLNIVMPAGSGDIAKSYFAYKEAGNKEQMFIASIYDKLVAIASMFFLSIYAYYYTQNIWILIAGVISCIPWGLVHLLPSFSKVKMINKGIQAINNRVKKVDLITFLSGFTFSVPTIISSFILSIIGWMITYILLFYCFFITGLINISLNDVIGYSPILTLARLFPLTFNGIGSDEALITYLFKGYNTQLILLGSIIYRIILIFIPALIGLFFINKKSK
ncbi:MAG: flippase-like domain-containing protein [Cytophagales bacterium]|nr:flippase-like domain-containing protein [Cytophagales bacterium]